MRFWFTTRPNWLYYADPPSHDYITNRYIFALYATPDIYQFVTGLPGIQDTCLDEQNKALRVWFAHSDATDQMTAYKRWNDVLRSIEAHLDMPLHPVWEMFIDTLEFEV